MSGRKHFGSTIDFEISRECLLRLNASGEYGHTIELRVSDSGHGERANLTRLQAAKLAHELTRFAESLTESERAAKSKRLAKGKP